MSNIFVLPRQVAVSASGDVYAGAKAYFYFINGDWNTLGRGAARTGIALFIEQSINTGLTMVRKNTFRGFKDGHIVNSGNTAAFCHKVEHCECSLTFNGITIADGNSSALRMAGGVNFTPGANGAMITFVVEKNVVYERCRTAY